MPARASAEQRHVAGPVVTRVEHRRHAPGDRLTSSRRTRLFCVTGDTVLIALARGAVRVADEHPELVSP